MGAATKIYVQVLVTHPEWREVFAVTLDDAKLEAVAMPDVAYVIGATYEKPETLE